MTKAYIVTEGPIHIEILHALIPPELLQDVTFVDGEDKYNADPLARTLLSERQTPIVLVVDADTIGIDDNNAKHNSKAALTL